MKKIMLVLLAMVMLAGCYRPSWYRANTPYAELKTDSEWCKSHVNIGSTREETIEQYEKCMTDKGYELKDKSDSSSGSEPIKVERKEGPPIVINKRTRVYVGISGPMGVTGSVTPAYRYFHRKGCKHLWSVPTKEITTGEAIAEGRSMCPDCFRN